MPRNDRSGSDPQSREHRKCTREGVQRVEVCEDAVCEVVNEREKPRCWSGYNGRGTLFLPSTKHSQQVNRHFEFSSGDGFGPLLKFKKRWRPALRHSKNEISVEKQILFCSFLSVWIVGQIRSLFFSVNRGYFSDILLWNQIAENEHFSNSCSLSKSVKFSSKMC